MLLKSPPDLGATRQQLRFLSREKHIWPVRPVRTLSLRVFLRLGPRIPIRHEMGGCDRIKCDPPGFQSLPRVAHAHTNDWHGGSSDLGGCTSSTSDSRSRAAIRRSEACFRRGRYVPNRHEMGGRDRIERDAPHPPSILPRARARTTRTPATLISVARAVYLVCPSGSDPRADLARFRGSGGVTPETHARLTS